MNDLKKYSDIGGIMKKAQDELEDNIISTQNYVVLTDKSMIN